MYASEMIIYSSAPGTGVKGSGYKSPLNLKFLNDNIKSKLPPLVLVAEI